MKGSLTIIAFFIAGICCGYINLLPTWIADGNISFAALCLLMFCVGVSVGNAPQMWQRFRTLNPKLALLPLMTIMGTLAGSAVISLLLDSRPLNECLAIGSGFGYYSLSSILITESLGPESGTVALLSNISREIITLLAAPLLVRLFGNLAPIASGGATTADTTLPLITRYCGQELAVVSIYHGIVVDFSVPFLVTLFANMPTI